MCRTNASSRNSADFFPVVEDSEWATADADEGNRKRKPELGYCRSSCRACPPAGWEYHRPDAIGEPAGGDTEGFGDSLDGIDARLTAVFDLGKAGSFRPHPSHLAIAYASLICEAFGGVETDQKASHRRVGQSLQAGGRSLLERMRG